MFCSNCGKQLADDSKYCNNCGYELSGSSVANVVKEFADKLEKTDSISKKNELISNFYIPNTKEDIYDFFVLATSNLTTDLKCEEAWKSKLEQAYHKAKLSFGSTHEFKYIKKIYSKSIRDYKNQSVNRNLKRGLKYFLGSLLFIIGITMIIYGFFKGSESGDEDSPFYMVSLMGFIVLFAGVGFIYSASQKKNNSNLEDEEEEQED